MRVHKPLMVMLLLASSLAAGADEFTVEIDLEPTRRGDWQVEYSLSAPVDSLVFARGNGDYRANTWRLPRGFVLERLGATDRIRRQNGKPFDRLKATVRTYAVRIPKEYTPFIQFSDGSVAVFTGQFVVGTPASEDTADFIDGTNNDNTRWPSSATIALKPGRFGSMVAGTQVTADRQQLVLEDGDYVYFGSTEVLETPHLVSVMDAAAPSWLRQLLYESMAATFEFYEAKLGPLVAGKPFMFTSFTPLEGRRISFSGGVIGSQIAIQLALGDGITNTKSEREFMARFFAHESAHLWNNGQVIAVEPAEAWLHEGSAEAMAWLALADLGIYSDQTTLTLFEQAANECVAFLEKGPLRTAGRRDEFQAYYDCGATIALATHGVMRLKDGDLFTFWRRLLDASVNGDPVYRATDYYRQLDGVSADLPDAIRTLANDDLDDPQLAVKSLLETGQLVVYDDTEGMLRLDALP